MGFLIDIVLMIIICILLNNVYIEDGVKYGFSCSKLVLFCEIVVFLGDSKFD